MTLEDLTDDVEAAYASLKDLDVSLDEESRTELALLAAAFDEDDPADLVQRAVHVLFQSSVDSGKVDFHLRSRYDVTYDEYLSGMTYD
ncbi:MAG: hypothetical protein ABEJ76_03950, partial [Halanaeroarchaeum sp.]